jgi:hypothetical protein
MSSCDSIVKTNLIFGGCKLFVSLHLNNWLDLSLNHSLPSYLLILSRYLTTVLRISLVERYSRLIPSVEHFASQGKVKPEGCWSYTCFFAGWGCGYCLYDSIAIWRFCFRQEKIGVSWNARCIIYAIFLWIYILLCIFICLHILWFYCLLFPPLQSQVEKYLLFMNTISLLSCSWHFIGMHFFLFKKLIWFHEYLSESWNYGIITWFVVLISSCVNHFKVSLLQNCEIWWDITFVWRPRGQIFNSFKHSNFQETSLCSNSEIWK